MLQRSFSIEQYNLALFTDTNSVICKIRGTRGAPPVADTATRVSGRGRQMRKAFQSQRRCRAPQQGKLTSYKNVCKKEKDIL